MSKEKETTIFLCKMEAIVSHILQTFCNAYCFFHGMSSYEVSMVQLYEQPSVTKFYLRLIVLNVRFEYW